MRDLRIVVGIAVALISLATGSGSAEAQRKLLVLIDASGSMQITRPSDGRTRFEAAKTVSDNTIVEEGMTTLDGVAVYTFFDSGVVPHTGGNFVSPNSARMIIAGLTVTNGVTPLAGSMCDAITRLAMETATQRILLVNSDGEENATPTTHPCFGPFSTAPEPFTLGSWQNKVFRMAENPPGGVPAIIKINLFNNSQIVNFGAQAKLEALEPAAKRAPVRALADDGEPTTLEEFFTSVARVTGGSFDIIEDDAPLPVFGDLDGDLCVDHNDAFEVIRRFSQRTPAVDGRYDLDHNGIVGFNDYAIVVAEITGTCGDRDVLVPAQPVRCAGSSNVVLNGRSIETTGVAIDVRGSCRVTIRNSRIVTGGTALQIRGSATVVIEDSIIAGERVVLGLKGAATLSARGTYFKGKKEIDGSLQYIDRGGNTWE